MADHNVIAANDGPGVEFAGYTCALHHNDVWANTGGNYVNCDPGPGDISEDPLFVAGPQGNFYLAQEAAGDTATSPCVDAGAGTSEELGVDTLTTRRDEGPDEGMADLGYHYPTPLAHLPCGDCDGDGSVTPADGYFLLSYFGAGPAPPSCRAANVDGNDGLTPADAYLLLLYLGGGSQLNCGPCEE